MRWRNGILVTSAPDIFISKIATMRQSRQARGRAHRIRRNESAIARQRAALRARQLDYVNYPRVITPQKYVKEFGDRGGKLHFPGPAGLAPTRSPCRRHSFPSRRSEDGSARRQSQYGNSFDRWGNRFTVWNNDYLRHLVIESRYLEHNPYLAVEKAYQSVSGLDHAAEVYPVTQDPLVIHDSQAGHFTSACGMSIYTGGILPEDFEGDALTCEPVHNLIRRSKVSPDGPTFLAKPGIQEKRIPRFQGQLVPARCSRPRVPMVLFTSPTIIVLRSSIPSSCRRNWRSRSSSNRGRSSDASTVLSTSHRSFGRA